MYRIYLIIQTDCHEWTSTSMPTKRVDINNRIIEGIKDQCSHTQVKDDIIMINNSTFQCPSHPKKTVVYSTHLHGNDLTNTSILVSCLDKWIEKTQTIAVNEADLEINKECTSVINDDNSGLDCATTSHITIGEGFAVGLGIISAFLIAIIIVLVGGILW